MKTSLFINEQKQRRNVFRNERERTRGGIISRKKRKTHICCTFASGRHYAIVVKIQWQSERRNNKLDWKEVEKKFSCRVSYAIFASYILQKLSLEIIDINNVTKILQGFAAFGLFLHVIYKLFTLFETCVWQVFTSS